MEVKVDKDTNNTMLDVEEIWYIICNIKGFGSKKIHMLIELAGNIENVMNVSINKLSSCGFYNTKDIESFNKSRTEYNIKNKIIEYKNLNQKGVRFIYYGHKDYPRRLYNIQDPPMGLFVKGNLPDEDKFTVAIVGARRCSDYGRIIAEKIGSDMSKYGIQVISGMALGIDSAGQWGTLQSKGKSFAVLGCGVDICYPRENIELYDRLQYEGGIISEYMMGAEPLPFMFPLRNRIISGLADRVIVVEAKEKSGSLITVEYALEQGKDIFAVPGRICDDLSRGCNRLIKSGAAAYTCAEDLFLDLGLEMDKKNGYFVKNNNLLEKEYNVVYSDLDVLPKSLEHIIEETGLEAHKVLEVLTQLQLKDMACEVRKNYYAKIT